MIPVTKPFLPPRDEYEKYIKEIWDRNWLTNDGPLVRELEVKLKDYLQVSNMLYVANGTLALQLAIKALELKGEVITTPFSYVATTSSIVWEGCKPVFVDILPDKFTIDPDKIEAAITPRTTGILATHVYGIPCEVEKIQEIANRHNLKVIYDGAHAFGVKVNGKSIFEYGDISTCSFHATKIFHTIEGGAVFTKNINLIKKLGYLRNFGHDGFDKFNGLGINAKNSEFHAAMGLVNINYIRQILNKRKQQYIYYYDQLRRLPLSLLPINEIEDYNFSYFPIEFSSEDKLLETKSILDQNLISTRRYFYPSLNNLDYTDGDVPISVKVSKTILCLPLFHEIEPNEQKKIIMLLKNILI